MIPKNIIKRYEILTDTKPEFRLEQNQYIAELPLIEEEL
jgi:hypothetical protein